MHLEEEIKLDLVIKFLKSLVFVCSQPWAIMGKTETRNLNDRLLGKPE